MNEEFNKISAYIDVGPQEMEALNDLGKGLWDAVRQGRYTVEAQQFGEVERNGSGYEDKTTLAVQLTPAPGSPATVTFMSFTFQNDYKAEDPNVSIGHYAPRYTGNVTENFRIDTVSGRSYVSIGAKRELNYSTQFDERVSTLAGTVRALGQQKLRDEAERKAEEEWQKAAPEREAKAQQARERLATLKSDIKFVR